MKLLKLAFKPETAMPMLALIFASSVSVALVFARMVWTGKTLYGFLVWNLFLAWLPLLLALLACNEYQDRAGRNWRFGGLAGAWLLFFPNAPYIFTDLIHLTTRFHQHFWVDLVLILSCAFTGLVIGFVSLYLMQSLVTRRFGHLVGWLFVAAVAGLSGFGIYLGRFLRFNSWDVLLQPLALYRSIGTWAADPLAHSTTFAFPALFATFLFISYLMLYALTHLQQAPLAPLQDPEAHDLLLSFLDEVHTVLAEHFGISERGEMQFLRELVARMVAEQEVFEEQISKKVEAELAEVRKAHDEKVMQIRAAFGDLRQTVTRLETFAGPKTCLTPEQLGQLRQATATLGTLLQERGVAKPYPGIYMDITRLTGVSRSEDIRQEDFPEVIAFLETQINALTRGAKPAADKLPED